MLIKSLPIINKIEQKDFEKFDSIKEAKEYFMRNSLELFDCGQGYFENECSTFCFVMNRFFQVNISAELFSAKQDVGDKLYWVECPQVDKIEPYSFVKYKENEKINKDKLIAQKELELKLLRES